HGRRHASQQRGDFRARLGEAEDVVDEQQRVRAFLVAEVLSHGQAGQSYAETRSRRLGHLAVNQGGLRLIRHTWLDHTGFRHFQPQIVAFAGTLAYTSKHGESTMLLGYVVDELHDDDGFAHAGAAKQSDFSTFQERLDQVDDLDAGLKHLRLGGLLLK